MKAFKRVGEATAPDGTVLTLYEHDGAYGIRVNGVELMSTRRHESEDKIAELVCMPLQRLASVRVLIGGLGLGFTLKAALRCLATDARVVVAEIIPAVVAWNRDLRFGLAGTAVDDERDDLRLGDVAHLLQHSPRAFDAIMMDVDNGANALTTAANTRLYCNAGIEIAAAALRPNGRLAYWSAHSDRAFEQSLRRVGMHVVVTNVRSHPSSRTYHTVFVAQRSKDD